MADGAQSPPAPPGTVERIVDRVRVVPMPKLAVTRAEAAQALSVHVSLVDGLIRSGDLPSFTIGSARRIPVEGLRDYIAARLRAASY